MVETTTEIFKSYPGRYSCVPDHGDPRDVYFASIHNVPKVIDPNTVIDLSKESKIPIWNQKDFGACTLFSSGFGAQFCAEKNKLPLLERLGFLMPYYNMRAIEHAGANNDSGGMIRDALKALKLWGVCDEKYWAYDAAHFALKPDEAAQKNGALHKVGTYLRVKHSLNEMIGCLMQGYPFVFGFSVPQNFEDETGATGVIKLPRANEPMLGGHAVACVGADYPNRQFKIRNSWDVDWGTQGYFKMPFDFMLDSDLTNDFWTCRTST